MRIGEVYSHLNGEEYLLVHCDSLYQEIKHTISSVDAERCTTKISKEKTMRGKRLISPRALNKAFDEFFHKADWASHRYRYYVTTSRKYMQDIVDLPFDEQRLYLKNKGVSDPIWSYKQTDFVKNRVAVEVQFGKYPFVAYDLFVKHLLFFSGDIINVGVEILPMKEMLRDLVGGRRMSTGIAYFEGEVYNILRHGRTSPPVPLLIIGVAP